MSKESFPHLFAPLQLAGLTLKNRVFQAPMCVCYSHSDGYVTQAMIEHYGRRARGGVGMVITENLAVSLAGRQLPKQGLIYDERFLPGLAKLASEIKQHGAVALIQLVHAGRYAGSHDEHDVRRRLAPSAIPFPLHRGTIITPEEITRGEIREAVRAFGKAALLAQQAGFDGVEIHGAQGFLISEFLSPRMNRRTDEYGGSFENRTRFALEVVREVKERVGRDFLVGFHLMSDEMLPGGWGVEEAVALAHRLEREDIHFLIPIAATFETVRTPQHQDFLARPLHNHAQAIVIKRNVRIPVFANGRLEDPYVAERILAQHEADAIGLARPLLVDPDWVKKVAEGRIAEIHTCSCTPPLCLRTQVTGGQCTNWPEAVKARGYLGYAD